MNKRCPICFDDGRLRFTVEGYHVVECNACQHSWMADDLTENHISTHYGDSYFEGGGEGYSNYFAYKNAVEEKGRYYLGVVERNQQKPGNLLAIGTAAGFELDAFRQGGWHLTAVEPNQRMAEYARENYADSVTNSAIEDFNSSTTYDLVTAIQVIAHIADQRELVAKIAQLTAPTGLVLIETWNYRSFTARCFGRRWHEYNPPSVLHWFSKGSLNKLMQHEGFELVSDGRPPKGVTGGHAKSLIAHRTKSMWGGSLVRLASRIIPTGVTIPYPGNDVFWALYRKGG